MEITDVEYGNIMSIISNIDELNPNAGVQIKLTSEGFVLYYIAAERIDYKDSKLYRECMETGNKRLDDVETELKKQFKDKTGKSLSFKLESSDDSLEMMSPALKRYYLRIFRNYKFN